MDNLKPLENVAKIYYWDPMGALFRSLENRIYCNSNISLKGPILDLGCGDGRSAHMLRESILMEDAPHGIDISYSELKKAKVRKKHLILFQADANILPFRNNSFSSIISNGVLSAIPEGVEQLLKEVNRVLKNGGMFITTVPTDKFIDVLIMPKILKKLSRTFSSIYIKKLSNRILLFNAYSAQEWKRQIEDNGLNIIKVQGFFSYKTALFWNILSMQVFRISGLLKFVRNKYFIIFISNLYKKVFRKTYIEDLILESDSGYIFIIAQKTACNKNPS